MTPIRFFLPLAFVIAIAPAAAQTVTPKPGLPRTRAPAPTTADISPADLMTRTYVIADDSMEGRDTGRRGGVRSANYIASELKRLGLEPAGDRGTYLQAIPWASRRPDPASMLMVGDAMLDSAAFLLIPRIGLQTFLGG